MKKGVWVGGLILSLGGWTGNLLAQDGAWRPAAPGPVPVTLAPSELKPCPAAALGRPVPVTGEAAWEPKLLLPAPGVQQVNYQLPALPAAAATAAPSAKDIPGGNMLPTWEEVSDDPKLPPVSEDGGFASDRVHPVLAPKMNSPLVQPAALMTSSPLPPAILDVGVTTPSGAPMPVSMAMPLVEASSPAVANPAPISFGSLPSVRPYVGGEFTQGDVSSTPVPVIGRHETAPYAPFADAPHELNPLYPHYYGSVEYLLWTVKKDSVPVLVSSSPASGSGFLDQPTTTVLFGGGPIGGDARSGLHANVGMWLDTWCEEAIEIGGFFLAPRSTKFDAVSAPGQVLARPFFNVNNNTEFAEIVAAPGVSTGTVHIQTPSSLWGLDTNLRCNVCMSCDQRFDLLAGFRYLDLSESVDITENVVGLAGAPAPFTNANTTVMDRFATQNKFYGGQVGMASEWRRGIWSLNLNGKLALGATTQQLNINGNETIVGADGTVRSFNGGLLALPSNSGQFSQTHFSVVPEIGVTIGCQLTDTIRLYAGYNFLYWTNVIRPGAQIDRNLDVTQIPNFNIAGATPASGSNPSVPFKQSDFWAQGLVVGLEFRY